MTELNSETAAPYGFCPACGAKGVMRQRRPDGDDRCAAGHIYSSKAAQPMPFVPIARTPLETSQAVQIVELQKTVACLRAQLDDHSDAAINAEIADLKRQREQHWNWSSGIMALIKDVAIKCGIDTTMSEAYSQITEIGKWVDMQLQRTPQSLHMLDARMHLHARAHHRPECECLACTYGSCTQNSPCALCVAAADGRTQ